VQNVSPIRCAARIASTARAGDLLAGRSTHPLLLPNTLFKTTDGGQTWQTISPDRRASTRAFREASARWPRKIRSGSTARSDLRVAPGVHDTNTIWAGTDDGLIWVTAMAARH